MRLPSPPLFFSLSIVLFGKKELMPLSIGGEKHIACQSAYLLKTMIDNPDILPAECKWGCQRNVR